MARHDKTLTGLAPVFLILFVNAGCSGANLGNFDDSNDSREEMPGPGIFADESGESALTWSSDSNETKAVSSETTTATATATASTNATESATTSSAATVSAEQAEFEQFKAWKELRTNNAESAEYQEFLQWLEFQKFKSNQ